MSIIITAIILFLVFEGRQFVCSSKTIRSEEGYLVDCVDIYDQPVFKNPLLKNHRTELRSSKSILIKRNYSLNSASSHTIYQTWHKSGSCPKGTIPVARNHNNFSQTKGFQISYHPWASVLKDSGTTTIDEAAGYVSALPGVHYFSGTKGDIEVWQPKVEANDKSLAYISTIGMGGDGKIYYVRVGWQVSPSDNGDSRPRITVMRSGSDCINQCSGFLQTSNKIAVNEPLYPVSSYGGQRMIMAFKIQRDDDFNWRIYVNEEELGYYPAELMPEFVQGDNNAYGGAVFINNTGGKQTVTEMGNGYHPVDNDFINSARITRIYSLDYSGAVVLAKPPVSTLITNQPCYNFVSLGNVSPANQLVVAYGGSCK